jgi:hypothetical protein
VNQRVCTVRGKDYRSYPLTVNVHAYSLFEAAARAMEEIRKADGVPSDLEVTVHSPGKQWKVKLPQLAKWISTFGSTDNVGLRDVKRNVREFLNKHR